MRRHVDRDEPRQHIPGPPVGSELVQIEPVHEQSGQERDDRRAEQHDIEGVSQESARHPGGLLIHHGQPPDRPATTSAGISPIQAGVQRRALMPRSSGMTARCQAKTRSQPGCVPRA